ncbi:hypothetical protein ALC56_11658, partial [Trachymyrmex septentrionalis]
EGKYTVKLLVTEEVIERFGDSRDIALFELSKWATNCFKLLETSDRNSDLIIYSRRSTVRKTIQGCITCFRIKPKILEAIMGSLPSARVNVFRSFSQCGVDYADPVLLRKGKRRAKSPDLAPSDYHLFLFMADEYDVGGILGNLGLGRVATARLALFAILFREKAQVFLLLNARTDVAAWANDDSTLVCGIKDDEERAEHCS